MKQSVTKRTLSLFCAMLLLITTGCGASKPVAAVVEETPAVAVHTQTPTRASLEQYATFAGRISPDETVAVIGKIGGTVQQVNFEIGDTVRKGQVLYVIDPVDIQLVVDQAKITYDTALKNIEIAESGSGDALTILNYETRLEQARQSYESAREALDLHTDDDFDMSEFRKVRKDWKDATRAYDNATGDGKDTAWDDLVKAEDKYYDLLDDYNQVQSYVTGFENAYTNYEMILDQYDIYKSQQTGENTQSFELQRQAAENDYQQALQKLADTQVTAPIDGVVEQKNITANSMFGTSSPAYVISNKNIVNVEFSVSADIARAMTLGDAVKVESGSTIYNAEVVEIGNAASSASGLFTVKARIEDGSDLFTGVSVKLTAITAKATDALAIPIGAIYYESGNPYVYLAIDGIAVKTPVVTGVATNELIEVLEGIAPDDELITTWDPNLNDQIAVNVLPTDADTTVASPESSTSEADHATDAVGQEG